MSSVRFDKEVTGVLRAVCLIFTTPQNCLIFALFFTVALLYDICLIFFGQGWEFIIKEKKKVNKKVTTHTSTKIKKKDSSCFYSSDRQIIQSC